MAIIAEVAGGSKDGGWLGRGREALGRLPGGALVAAVIILASTGSFGLGFLAGSEAGAKEELRVEDIPLSAAALSAAGAASPAPASAPEPAPGPVAAPASVPAGGQYVASKSGTKYYLPWCGTVKNIKEENKVWFATKEEAEAKGYAPAANCKGL